MADTPEFRVYISSTIDDLIEEREAAKRTITEDGGVIKDSYRASEDPLVESCVKDVRDAHLYVGIYGQRYGWVPDEKADSKSITEHEYDACQQGDGGPIPRLIFLRILNEDRFNDAVSGASTAARMKRFLDRIRREQRPILFKTIAELELELSRAVRAAKEKFINRNFAGTTLLISPKIWESALRPVVLIHLSGDDANFSRQIVDLRPTLFTQAKILTSEDDLLGQLDQSIQKGQFCCFVGRKTSLDRMKAPEQLPRFTHAMSTLRERLGHACFLWLDDDNPEIPEAWQPVHVVRISSTSLVRTPESTVQKIYAELEGIRDTLTTETCLALCCLVIAPTRAEVQSLLTKDSEFDNHSITYPRDRMRRHINLLTDVTLKLYPAWIEDTYGINREDWRCFGPNSNTVADLIKGVVKTINNSQRGDREREVLQDAKILVRHYKLDEYLKDIEGSRRTIKAMEKRGCLIVIDETALLHPSLQDAAAALLDSPKSAIVSVSPYDPAQMATRQMLEDWSFLRVDSMINRFKTEQDPQCEIALNSEERVQRWLRTAIPRLIKNSAGSPGRPIFRADSLLT